LYRASIKYAILYHESTKVLKHEKIKQLDFLGLVVSVIDYCDLGFICYLVLEIWNLYLDGSGLLTFSRE